MQEKERRIITIRFPVFDMDTGETSMHEVKQPEKTGPNLDFEAPDMPEHIGWLYTTNNPYDAIEDTDWESIEWQMHRLEAMARNEDYDLGSRRRADWMARAIFLACVLDKPNTFGSIEMVKKVKSIANLKKFIRASASMPSLNEIRAPSRPLLDCRVLENIAGEVWCDDEKPIQWKKILSSEKSAWVIFPNGDFFICEKNLRHRIITENKPIFAAGYVKPAESKENSLEIYLKSWDYYIPERRIHHAARFVELLGGPEVIIN